jgi:hypothetical protein
MDIQKELDVIRDSKYAGRSDRKLHSIEDLSRHYKEILNGSQPESLREFNDPLRRQTKLSSEYVNEIRKKYRKGKYGFLKLAKEYGVSKSVIIRIIRGASWKVGCSTR